MTRKALEHLEAGLPAAWYRDPAHYERELEAFWYGRWIAAAREEEIPSPGDWRVVRIGSQAIVLLRGNDLQIKAFHNTCRHRGSILCTQDQGHFERNRIVCPYHSWTYDLAGQLVATPRRMETPDFDKKDFPLHEIGVDVWGGYVFLRIDKNSISLKKKTADLQKRFENYAFENLRIGKRIVHGRRANWK